MTRRIFTSPVIVMMLVAGFFLAVANPGVSPTVNAQSKQTVPVDWAHIPDGLGAGDSFRLMFVTSGARDATADNIADYNTFVQNAAATNDGFKDFSGQFRALMNATEVNGGDNAGLYDEGLPIYWVDGAKIANDYHDFADGSWASNAGTDEKGNKLDSKTTIWVATHRDETDAAYESLGEAGGTLELSTALKTERKRLYALSPVLQVATSDSNDSASTDDGTGVTPPPQDLPTPVPTPTPEPGAPTISGTAQVGETLTASVEGLNDVDYSYQWLADDVEIAGATGETYVVRAEDEGKAIKVRVDFTDSDGNAQSLTSAPTTPVVLGGL